MLKKHNSWNVSSLGLGFMNHIMAQKSSYHAKILFIYATHNSLEELETELTQRWKNFTKPFSF